ncbi:MAG TPA: preprotein translocase subunit SecE [Caulobacteraceae bacterium]|nr:preprotein translocase subunit SecE [Caulobacteraceae bacterium]
MAKDQGIVQTSLRQRTPARGGRRPPTSGGGAGTEIEAAPKKRTSPVQFLREVRAEARKITWTSWKETWITSVMVGIMVVLTAAFFAAVDGVIHFGVGELLKLAGAQ